MCKTWFLDFDGTLVYHKSHLVDEDIILPKTQLFFDSIVGSGDIVVITTARTKEDYGDRVEKFMAKHNFKYHAIVYGVSTGPRILVNDLKSDGSKRAYAINVTRDGDDMADSVKMHPHWYS